MLFSFSFFFDGLTGLTITVGSIITVVLLMTLTARVNLGGEVPRRHGPGPGMTTWKDRSSKAVRTAALHSALRRPTLRRGETMRAAEWEGFGWWHLDRAC